MIKNAISAKLNSFARIFIYKNHIFQIIFALFQFNRTQNEFQMINHFVLTGHIRTDQIWNSKYDESDTNYSHIEFQYGQLKQIVQFEVCNSKLVAAVDPPRNLYKMMMNEPFHDDIYIYIV